MPTRPPSPLSPDDFWVEVVIAQISSGQSTEVANRSANTLALGYEARLTARRTAAALTGIGVKAHTGRDGETLFEINHGSSDPETLTALGLAPHPDRVIAWLAEDIGELPWSIDAAGLTRAADNELIDEHDDPAFVAAVNAACARVEVGELAPPTTAPDLPPPPREDSSLRARVRDALDFEDDAGHDGSLARALLVERIEAALLGSPQHLRSGEAGLTLTGEMSDGELGLELDVDGHTGTTWLSRATYDAIGVGAGWEREPVVPDMRELTAHGGPQRAAECADLFSPPAPDTLSRLQRIHDAGADELDALARVYEVPPGRYGDALRRDLLGCELLRAREYSTLQKDYTPVAVEWRDPNPSRDVLLVECNAANRALSAVFDALCNADADVVNDPTTYADAIDKLAARAKQRGAFFRYLELARILCEDVGTQDETGQADTLRDLMDAPERAMTDAERKLAAHYMSLLPDASETRTAVARDFTQWTTLGDLGSLEIRELIGQHIVARLAGDHSNTRGRSRVQSVYRHTIDCEGYTLSAGDWQVRIVDA